MKSTHVENETQRERPVPLAAADILFDSSLLLFLCDIDGTIWPTIILKLAQQQQRDGFLSDKAVLKLQKIWDAVVSGKTGYEVGVRNLLRTWIKYLAGKPYREIESHAAQFLGKEKTEVESSQDEPAEIYCEPFPFVAPLFEKVSQTHRIVLVTGEPNFVGHACAKNPKLKKFVGGVLATEYEINKEGNLAGRPVKGKMLAHKKEKARAITTLCDTYPGYGMLAMGDSVGDLEMFLAVIERGGYAIWMNPKEKDLETAKKYGIRVATHDTVISVMEELLAEIQRNRGK